MDSAQLCQFRGFDTRRGWATKAWWRGALREKMERMHQWCFSITRVLFLLRWGNMWVVKKTNHWCDRRRVLTAATRKGRPPLSTSTIWPADEGVFYCILLYSTVFYYILLYSTVFYASAISLTRLGRAAWSSRTRLIHVKQHACSGDCCGGRNEWASVFVGNLPHMSPVKPAGKTLVGLKQGSEISGHGYCSSWRHPRQWAFGLEKCWAAAESVLWEDGN